MTVTSDPTDNARQLKAMADALDRLLDGDAPYREVVVEQADGGSRVATMSVGMMLDLLLALQGRDAELSDEDREAVAESRSWIRTLRRARRDDYVERLRSELKGQLDAWRWYLDDCVAGEGPCAEVYASEARKRTRIQQLLDEADALGADVTDARTRVRRLDQTLRGIFLPGDYGGEPGREETFPEDEYWWLYGEPRRKPSA